MKNENHRGIIAFMVNNSVAANILLMVLMVGGLVKLSSIKQEIFPEFELDFVTVSVVFPGASPKEVETGILLPIEESVRGIEGVKRVHAKASEGIGAVTIECLLGADAEKVTDDVKNAVDRIRVFPKNSEKPITKRVVARSEVISLVLFGNVPEEVLRIEAEKARDELLEMGDITLVDLVGTRNREIAVEVPYQNLAGYGLTLGSIAQELSLASVEVPGGQLKTNVAELNLRTNDKRSFAKDYQDIVIRAQDNGERLKLSDIATIKETFEEEDKYSKYNGKPAVMVKVYRTGEQKPADIAKRVKEYQKQLASKLPPGVSSDIWNDFSQFLSQRIELLVKNAVLGLILVFIILGLFLEPRLAFWVTLGIPTSFLGSFLFLPYLGVSINMLSLFAFIVTLGMVVDDAIVVGENIYTLRGSNPSKVQASIKGTKEIYVPVIFAILTTMAAFSPLLFVPGIIGKFFFVIPVIVLTVLFVSLVESLLILPNHLAHSRSKEKKHSFLDKIKSQQCRFSNWFSEAVKKYYRPLVEKVINYRYATLAISVSMLILVSGIIAGGRLKFSFMPNMDSDIVLLHAEYAQGKPISETLRLEEDLLSSAKRALVKLGGEDKALGFYSQVGSTLNPSGPGLGLKSSAGSHMVDVMVYLVSTENRNFSSEQFSHLWEKELGEVSGLRSLTFKSTTGPDTGRPVAVLLKHKDVEVLELAAKELANSLRSYRGLHSVEDGISDGKEQIEFKLKESAYHLGLKPSDLGHQVRHAFYGAEAIRRQRGRDEVKVMVRLPKSERASFFDIENFRIQTPHGEVLLSDVADIKRSTSYSEINREDGSRVITVSADVIEGQANGNEVMSDLKKNVLPIMAAHTPGLRIVQSGEQREQADSMGYLGLGFLLALIGIYGLLAIPLKSYVQPLIIMSAIPFGIIGAAMGHMIMGFNLSIISMMGIVALSGIVVNDSLVFIHAANQIYQSTGDLRGAIIDAGVRRFRPILLTSLTTFFGLVPMILETSLQARFLIPMAISIAFGVMFATMVILLLIPALYIIVHDISVWLRLFSTPRDFVEEKLSAGSP